MRATAARPTTGKPPVARATTGKVARAGRRRSADEAIWYRRFDDLLGELMPAWEAAGGSFEELPWPTDDEGEAG